MMKVVVFSGAGMSAESGIQTFRDSNGLWENYKIEDIATPEAWAADPNLVTEFYNMRRQGIIKALPNKAHQLIADLEELVDIHVITQNIDDLHERSGSINVLHLHGNIRFAKSSGPNQERQYYFVDGWKLTENDKCPDGFRLRPHVVWFGESVPAYNDAIPILSDADVLIVIGTSLQVYPAAGLIQYADKAQYKFVIDPKAESLGISGNYKIISTGAEEGMEYVFSEIKKVLKK